MNGDKIVLKRADFIIDDDRGPGGSFQSFICIMVFATSSSSVSTDRL